jgi:mono/diheme cytochrome c family protein
MRATLLVLSLLGSAAASHAADAAKGKAVYGQQCVACHSADTDERKMGPALKGLFKKAKMANGKQPTDANVQAKIDEGGNGMPPYKEVLTKDEKADLMAYLKTI